MKRILVLALVACFVLGASMASAKEMNFKGQFEQTLQWTDNEDFMDNGNPASTDEEDDFSAQQRVRLYFEYITSEDLRAVIGFEFDTTWGAPDNANEYGGGAIGSDGGELEIKHAYIDFKTGPVSWRTGLQGLAFPSEVAGSPIFASDLAGVVASYAFNENVSLVAAWTRLMDTSDDFTSATTNVTDQANDETDAAIILLPITMDGWNITPYAAYAWVGTDGTVVQDLTNEAAPAATAYTDTENGLWLGAALGVDAFDPFTFGMDLIYGSVSGDDADVHDRSGWFGGLIGTYKGFDMVTPSIAFLYGSGEDDSIGNGSETMPTLANGGGSNSGLALTHWGLNAAAGTCTGDILNDGRTDFWALALVLDDIKFVDALSHRFVVMYGKGTSDEQAAGQTGVNITEDDSFWEVNFDTTYAIYENLSLTTTIGFLDVDRDEDNWGANAADLEAASKLAVTLSYKF